MRCICSDRVRRQLLHDALAMRLDRAPRDEQLRRDLVVRVAADQQLEDLALAPGQALDRLRPGVLRARRRPHRATPGRQVAEAAEHLADRIDDLGDRLRLDREAARARAEHVGDQSRLVDHRQPEHAACAAGSRRARALRLIPDVVGIRMSTTATSKSTVRASSSASSAFPASPTTSSPVRDEARRRVLAETADGRRSTRLAPSRPGPWASRPRLGQPSEHRCTTTHTTTAITSRETRRFVRDEAPVARARGMVDHRVRR